MYYMSYYICNAVLYIDRGGAGAVRVTSRPRPQHRRHLLTCCRRGVGLGQRQEAGVYIGLVCSVYNVLYTVYTV